MDPGYVVGAIVILLRGVLYFARRRSRRSKDAGMAVAAYHGLLAVARSSDASSASCTLTG